MHINTQHFSHCNNYSESEEEGPRRGLGKFESQKQHGLILDGEIAGLRKKRPALNPALVNKGVGTWEKHTRGIGAKLLLQVCLKVSLSGVYAEPLMLLFFMVYCGAVSRTDSVALNDVTSEYWIAEDVKGSNCG